MDLESICGRLCASDVTDDYITTVAKDCAELVTKDELKIIDFVRGLDSVLTNGNHNIRTKGVSILSQLLTLLPKDFLTETEIDKMTEFMTLRLLDHKSMEKAALKCISYFMECKNKASNYNKNMLEFLKSKVTVRRMDANTRHIVYEIAKKIVVERQNTSNTVDGEFIYTLVTLMEDENNPENLILCFGIISNILRYFKDIEPYIDDLFEWLASYYPLDYTPSDSDNEDRIIRIQRSDLVEALYCCFYANPLNAECLMSMLLEKLDSNVMSSKIESLNCLIKCYEVFPLDSVKKYNSTLWTAIRSNCLRKSDTIDNNFLNLSLKTLESLAAKLAIDRELHFTFFSDIYEELAIAFRKPEMDLFEPAAKLITHSIVPTVVGFNYVLDKILVPSINAIMVGELRPVTGLVYIFELLHQNHPRAELDSNLNPSIRKLCELLLDHVQTDLSILTLFNAIFKNKVDLDDETLDKLASHLYGMYQKEATPELEKCIVLLRMSYKRLHLVDNLCDVINHRFNLEEELSAMCLYLSSVVMLLHECPNAELDKIASSSIESIKEFLSGSRKAAYSLRNKNFIDKVAHAHAIILNKLEVDHTQQILMDLFSSELCQQLIPPQKDSSAQTLSTQVYLPILSWTFKSLVIRNHPLFNPLVNLLLNYITSDSVEPNAALDGARVFGFIQSDDNVDSHCELKWQRENGYQVFALHKQKFYTQTVKEIKIRYDKETDVKSTRRQLLLCSLILQIPHLPLAVYKRDIDWLLREIIRTLSIISSYENDELLLAVYSCLGALMQRDLTNQLAGFLSSLIDLNLKHAREAQTLRVRQIALKSLTNITDSFKESELLVYRKNTVDKLRPCLVDKKRLVRQAAAEARLKWTLVGQPIGS